MRSFVSLFPCDAAGRFAFFGFFMCGFKVAWGD